MMMMMMNFSVWLILQFEVEVKGEGLCQDKKGSISMNSDLSRVPSPGPFSSSVLWLIIITSPCAVSGEEKLISWGSPHHPRLNDKENFLFILCGPEQGSQLEVEEMLHHVIIIEKKNFWGWSQSVKIWGTYVSVITGPSALQGISIVSEVIQIQIWTIVDSVWAYFNSFGFNLRWSDRIFFKLKLKISGNVCYSKP